MANTLVGVYDKFSAAQGAYDELISCGFDRGDLQLSPSDESSDSRQSALHSAGTTAGDTTDHSFGSGVRNFFHNLFSGSDEYREHADVYAEAVRRGHYLITVHADNDEERVQATQVMNRFGPIDIEERAAEWKTRGWSSYDETAPALSDSEIAEERRYYSTGPSATIPSAAGASALGAGATSTSTMNTNAATSSASDKNIADTTRADTSAAADRTVSEPATTRMSEAESSAAQRKTATASTTPESTTIPVIQEELQVGKREVQRGGVRVYQHVRETPVDQSVRLNEEHVHVERHAVDRPASETDLSGLKESSFEMREKAEEVVVGKTARIVEEVVVSKEASERTQEIHDKVRRTDVEVEQLGTSGRDASTTAASALSSDEDYRRHFQTAYGSTADRFEDYEPAYRYGSTVAADDRFRGHNWDESEKDVHADWDARYGSATPWEKAKNAVRYAWEKTTR